MSNEEPLLTRFKITQRYDPFDDRDYGYAAKNPHGDYVLHSDAVSAIQAVRAQWAAEVEARDKYIAELESSKSLAVFAAKKWNAERDSAQAEAKALKADVARGKMALQALHYWHTEYTGREPSESVFARMAMEALCGPIPDAHALQAEINDLRYLLDTRPAMNAGLAEAYAVWTAKVYIAEHSRATLTNPRAGETA